MTRPGSPPDVSTLVRHKYDAAREIIRCVEEGTYCAVLGPRLSGKTELLRFVDRKLAEYPDWICVYVDLYDMQASTQRSFFAGLSSITAQRIQEISGRSVSVPDAQEVSSAMFRAFLAEVVTELQRDLVLIIEHLEAIPSDLVQALLTSLRAAYMEQQTLDYRLVVVVSGALSLAALTVGESSPFRGIAHRVFVGDLSEAESLSVIEEYIASDCTAVTGKALQRLLRAAQGDPYLIQSICQRCVQQASGTRSGKVRGRTVRRVVRDFLNDEVLHYAPLLEAVRLIEDDPDLLRCILFLLEREAVPMAELPLPLSPDVDPLYLTGVVERVQGDNYRLQNAIYTRFLSRHFHPGRVGRLLTMAGRWDSAIEYLEASIEAGNSQSRTDLLPAIIHSMYASEDESRAARYLLRGLSSAFGVTEAQVWHVQPQEDRLRLIGQLGSAGVPAAWGDAEMSSSADRLEARACRQIRSLRVRDSNDRFRRAIPLTIVGQPPVGVVTMYEELAENGLVEQRERDLQLVGYLNQAARAIYEVSTRRWELAAAWRMQASLLPKAPPELPGWQLAATLRPARETSGDFYDFVPLRDGRLGIVIADVADKGMGAALYMALSRTLIRTYAAEHPTRPDLVLQAANHRILADTRGGLFVTAFYGILDPASATLTYCNAGHPPPTLFGPDSGVATQTLLRTGMALGVVWDTTWEQRVLQVDSGTALLLYTDGVADAHNWLREPFGVERMVAAAQASLASSADGAASAQGILDSLLTEIYHFVGDEAQFDDITAVVALRER